MSKKEEKTTTPVLVENRKARFDYHILETVEAGLALVGTEIKSLRARQANIQEAYCRPIGGELFLVGAKINEYDKGNRFNHDPERKRKLLLHRHEIIRLTKKVESKGLTLIPLRLYLKKGKVKVAVALCEGKHTYDKSESLKEKARKRDDEIAFAKNSKRH
ncbi:SsrA-binding protein SmpB [bacterium]|nr:SsrA-binding protein SmpB [bacterium]